MPEPINFLLGHGERLTEKISPPSLNPEKAQPYSFDEARGRLTPMLVASNEAIKTLPPLACPNDEAVAILRMHPEFIAKSYFPNRLLREVGLQSIGSRTTRTRPTKWTRRGPPEVVETTDLFVAAPRSTFQRWSDGLANWNDRQPAASDVSHIEEIRPQAASDRLQRITPSEATVLLEVVLHASADRASEFIVAAFEAWLQSLDSVPLIDRRLYFGGLCFMPVSAPTEKLNAIAEFSFIRTVRQMPRLRMLKPPIIRSVRTRRRCELSTANSLGATSTIAIFDGGLSGQSPLTKWITPVDPPGIGPTVADYLEHGHQVSSAFLFGGIDITGKTGAPFSAATHYRVLDSNSASDPLELYEVLQRIRSVLGSQHFDFINLSIGPELPIEDTDVHAWTAFIDEHLEDGNALAAIAVGNGGENDRQTGNARIQVPSDSVNALAVGACDSPTAGWSRAPYSSFGPGRSPGIVKPDCVDFGGSESEPFHVIDSADSTFLAGTMGTSFATPAALRMAVGIRSYLGPVMTPLAVKALLIHCTECDSDDRSECGWGRVAQSVEEHIVCPDGAARIVYQGELTPAQFLRAPIPVPEEMKGNVVIRATFCYATKTDPQHPGSYTRSGLDVRFRPHDQRFTSRDGSGDLPGQPDSKSFFQLRSFSTESELRKDAHKWETTLHREKAFRARSLRNPVFDIHYVAREGGAPVNGARKIRYALIITVSAPKTPELYDSIRRRYGTILIPLKPIISVPIRV